MARNSSGYLLADRRYAFLGAQVFTIPFQLHQRDRQTGPRPEPRKQVTSTLADSCRAVVEEPEPMGEKTMKGLDQKQIARNTLARADFPNSRRLERC